MSSARLIIYTGAAPLGGLIGHTIYKMGTKEEEKVRTEVVGDYEHKSRSKDVDAIIQDDVVKLMKRFCTCDSAVK